MRRRPAAWRRAVPAALLALAALLPAAAQAQTAQTVQPGWHYVPSGVSPGQSFRLLFVTSTNRDATATSISTYNSFVQGRAAANTRLAGFSSDFRALISTSADAARDNTGTTGTGVPIYWLGGAKVADDYADFYDGSWDSRAGKTETGGSYALGSWSGSNADGTKHSTYPAGASRVQVGSLFRVGAEISVTWKLPTANSSLYALSPVITVAKPKASLVLGSTTIDESGSNNSTTLKATLPSAVSSAVTVTLSASPSGKVRFGGTTLTIAASATQSGTVTVTAIDNSADAPDASVTISGAVGGTAVEAPDDVTLTVADDDEGGGGGTPALPAAPSGLRVAAGNARLDLTWTAPAGTVTGYDVHHTSSASVADEAPDGANAATGWLDSDHTGTAPSLTIGDLTNGTAYRVRVRAVNDAGNGAWAFGRGTPAAPRPPGGGGGGGGGAPPRPPPGGGGGGGGGGAPPPVNEAPETAEEIADVTLRAGARVEIDLSDAFEDPDGDDLEYRAASSDETVATVAVDGDAVVVRGVRRGVVEITVTARDGDRKTASQTFAVTVTEPEAAWYLPPASDVARQGFVRVLNHSDVAGEVAVTATDDAGRTYDPLTLALGPRAAAHFHTTDLESGNAAKGLTGATGMGEGGWRLEFDSETLDVEALAYVRTPDGFLTGMNATAPRDRDGALEIAVFNPASNVDQVSLLRLVNTGEEEAEATVTGVDDAGASPGSPVRLTLPAGSACTVDAAQLESGMGLACGSPQEGLGDGAGKWRLTVESDARLVAMSLLSSPAGHLANLSAKAAADFEGMWHVDLFPAASDPLGRQGFVRAANRANGARRATVLAYDDSAVRYDLLRLSLGAGETRHFNSHDLETGNRAKGLTGSTGAGTGTWRLRMYGSGVEANAYVRTPDGFVTAMQARAPKRGSAHRVAFFNPGSNARTSVLRLVNRSSRDAEVSIDGTDDLGLRPGTTVSVVVPARDAVELTAAELESGEHGAIESGALGDGTGKWRLRVASSRIGAVLSLLSSPGGHLTNLSHADGARGLGELPAALLPPPETVTLESPARRELRGRWSAVAGALYAIDLLRDGVADEDRSLSNARNTTTSFHWTHLRPGTYALRACSVNEDRLRGPCRESDPVELD